VLALQRANYRDGSFHITQNKTGARVVVPHHALIQARVEAEIKRQAERHPKLASTFLIVSEETGRLYAADNFRHHFAEVRAEATVKWPAIETEAGERVAIADLQFLHLRHTAVTELAQAGATVPEIAAISGHSIKSVELILERYLVRTAGPAKSGMAKRALLTQMLPRDEKV